jgi:hypothetical protein
VFRRPKLTDGRASGEPGASDALRPLLYGDVPVDKWAGYYVDGDDSVWERFNLARRALDASDVGTAIRIWSDLAAAPDLESRQYLQAWTFLRRAGRKPETGEAKKVLGVIAEMPVGDGHDVLVAYEDGSTRYLNHSGKVALIDDRSLGEVQEAVRRWLEVGGSLVRLIGPWERPELPPLPPGHMRVMVLTPSGPHFGQGPERQMMAQVAARDFVQAATALLELVVGLSAQ